MNVIMLIIKKNSTLYIVYNECNNGDNEKKIIHYIGCNDCIEDDAKKWKK